MTRLPPEKSIRRRQRRRRTSGLSLLEVVVALGLLGFGVLAAGAAQLTSTRFSKESRLRTEAYYLAQQQVETFRNMDASTLDAQIAAGTYPNDPGNPIDPDTADGIVRAFNRSWTITADSPEAGLYTVAVQVSWVDSLGVSRSVTIETVTTGS